MSTNLQPLHQLLEKDRKWQWTKKCSEAVAKIKEIITSDMVLTHYNPELPVTLACDASSYGLGCVLSHIMPNGEEKPIAFASRTLNKAERKYSQIDKEALAIVWGVKKFNLFLYGKKFTLITDHKPLMTIFSPQKGISTTTAARLQRYALFLSGYSYDIKYKNTKEHGNCDSLSRLPLKISEDSNQQDATELFYMSHFEKLPVTADEIRRATDRDPILARVKDSVSRGWSNNTDNLLDPYFSRRSKLTLHQGCLIWGMRIVVPEKLRSRVIDELHEGHLGIVKVKSLTRNYVWWPKIDRDIEELTKKCAGCQKNRNSPPEAPIHPWEYPDKPWSRIHVDFAGPFLGSMFLVIVDSYSKWPIVKQMRKTTTTQTIEILRTVFSDYGLPSQLVSDNGPQLVSEEFKTFLRENGIQHILSAPYHPKTNGLAERFVQTFKLALKAAKHDPGTIQTKLSKFLIKYRNSPHSTTKECPSTLFLGRKLTTRLDLMKSNLSETVSKSQQKMVRSTRDRQFELGESVSVKDYRANTDQWIPGVIHKQTGPVSYKVEIAPHVYWMKPNLSETVSKSQQKMVRSTRDRQFELGESVSVKDYRANTDQWIQGVIHKQTGPVSYKVEIAPHVYWRRHSDQIQNASWSQPGETKLDLPVSGGTLAPPPLFVDPEPCVNVVGEITSENTSESASENTSESASENISDNTSDAETNTTC